MDELPSELQYRLALEYSDLVNLDNILRYYKKLYNNQIKLYMIFSNF